MPPRSKTSPTPIAPPPFMDELDRLRANLKVVVMRAQTLSLRVEAVGAGHKNSECECCGHNVWSDNDGVLSDLSYYMDEVAGSVERAKDELPNLEDALSALNKAQQKAL